MHINNKKRKGSILVYGVCCSTCICMSVMLALLYFSGKATLITIGGLAAGAVVGSAVENWLQVDIVPFLGVHSPATVVSEIIIFSQFLVSLYLL